MWGYCFLKSFAIPKISTPFSAGLPQVESAEGANYNNIFLALGITFMVLPSFGGRPPSDYEDIPSLESKKSQILSLRIALTHAQECFRGKIDVVLYMGIEFLSRLASAYGIQAPFFPVEAGDLAFLFQNDPSGIKIQHFHKVVRFHRGGQEMLHFLRIYPSPLDGLSSFILDLEWITMETFTMQVTPRVHQGRPEDSPDGP